MKWFRFSIAGPMALVIYVAIGLAAFSKVDDPNYGRLCDEKGDKSNIQVLSSPLNGNWTYPLFMPSAHLYRADRSMTITGLPA